MPSEIVQVRDVDSHDLAVLRKRAHQSGQSLSAYLRALLHDEASRMTNAEVVAQIAAEPAIQVSDEEIARYLAVERPQ